MKILIITHTRPENPKFEYSQPRKLVDVNNFLVSHKDEPHYSRLERMFLYISWMYGCLPDSRSTKIKDELLETIMTNRPAGDN
jgi:hypothetical protein